jgi:hypothetical protein
MGFLFIFLSLMFLSADLPLGFLAAGDQSRLLQCRTRQTRGNPKQFSTTSGQRRQKGECRMQKAESVFICAHLWITVAVSWTSCIAWCLPH